VYVGRSARQIGFSFVGFPSPVMPLPSLSPSAQICTNCSALQWPIHCTGNPQLSVRFAFAHCMTGPEDLPTLACRWNGGWKLMLSVVLRVGQSLDCIVQVGARLESANFRSFLPTLGDAAAPVEHRPLHIEGGVVDGVTSGAAGLDGSISAARKELGASGSTHDLHRAEPRLEHLSVETANARHKLRLNWPRTQTLTLRKLNRLGTGTAPTD
jgi:hypothetical protein